MTYRAREAFLAEVQEEISKPFTFVAITPGSIITIQGEEQRSGLVDVLYDCQLVAACMRDIETRAERIQTESA
jgi:hypothetical protein